MAAAAGKVARLICDVYRKDGTPYEGDPRYVLRKAVAEAEEMGYSMNVGPECEFFLFHTDEDGLRQQLLMKKADILISGHWIWEKMQGEI